MALWRVLDKTSGSLTLAVKHPPQTDTIEESKPPITEKARAATKNRGARAGFPRKLKIKKVAHFMCSTFNENGGAKGRGGRCRFLGGECGAQSELRLYLSPPRTIAYDSKFLIST